VLVAGGDVWKGRWVFVLLHDGRFQEALVVREFESAMPSLELAVVIAVDIPIGLPEPGRRRGADEQARLYVGPRWPSVFLAPSADLLAAESTRAANLIARTSASSGISAQTFALKRAIAEVAAVAERDPRIHEAHPEVSFVAANDEQHLSWPKATWNGWCLRRRILERRGVAIPDDLGSAGGAGAPDVLDAAAVAWTAARIASGTARRMPEVDDGAGAIWR